MKTVRLELERFAAPLRHTPCSEQAAYAARNSLPIRLVLPNLRLGFVLTYLGCYVSETFVTVGQHHLVTNFGRTTESAGDDSRPFVGYALDAEFLARIAQMEGVPVSALFFPHSNVMTVVSHQGLPAWHFGTGRKPWMRDYVAKHPPQGVVGSIASAVRGGRRTHAAVASALPTAWGLFDPFGMARTHVTDTYRRRYRSTLGVQIDEYRASLKTDRPHLVRPDRMLAWYLPCDDHAATRICLAHEAGRKPR